MYINAFAQLARNKKFTLLFAIAYCHITATGKLHLRRGLIAFAIALFYILCIEMLIIKFIIHYYYTFIRYCGARVWQRFMDAIRKEKHIARECIQGEINDEIRVMLDSCAK
jgi:uncharacterized membrane protein YagU involved in acid resistance